MFYILDPLQHYTTFLYNTDGQPTVIGDHLSNPTQFFYNTSGDLIKVIDPVNNTTLRELDSVGRLTKLTTPLKQSTRYEYDVLNRLTKVTDPLNGQTTFTYDANGNVKSVKDARNGLTQYIYDTMDRLWTRTDPLGRVEGYLYDANGNLQYFTDRKGQTTTFEYDGLNRRTKATFANTSTITYTYDPGNRLTQANDSLTGAVIFAYDALDRVLAEGTNREIVGYAYDKDGRRKSMNAVVGGQVLTYDYDDNDRLKFIHQGTSNVGFLYDDIDRRTKLTLPNGITVDYSYDTASRLTGLTYKLGTTTLGTLTYSYDANGQRTAVGGSLARTELPAALSGATYDAANKMLSFGSDTLSYDHNGNLVSDGTDTFTWNARNQLASMSGPQSFSASFSYDALGRRIQKTINGQALTYAHDGVNVLEELSGASVTARMLTGLGVDELFTRTDTNGTRHILADALGSTIALTDPAGVMQTQYTYEPFGETTVTGAASTNPFQFTGRENDGTTDLYYYRARYYHSTLQRFISEDPIGFAGGDVNLYAYVFNSPTNYTDPSGEVIPFIVACLGGAAFNVTLDVGANSLFGGKSGPQYGLGDFVFSAATGCVSGVAGLGLQKAVGVAGQILSNEIGAIGSLGGRAGVGLTSRIGQSSKLVREAEAAGRSAQRSIDKLTSELARGNLNPGIGTKALGNGISYARARDGARVFFRQGSNGGIEILGKATKANEQSVINEVLRVFGGQ